MPLTTVSNAWVRMGAKHGCRRAFGWRGRKPPVGCGSAGRRQSRSLRQQSHPTRFVAGAEILLACIRAQREPVVPPAGTGTEYPRPKGPPHGSRGGKASGRPLVADGKHTDQGNGGGRDSRSNGLLAPSPDGGQTGRAHRCRRRRALGSPARCGTFAPPPGSGRRGRGFASVRTPWGSAPLAWRTCACLSRTRSAACPCSPGSGCRTRTRRSCRCAGASVRRTAGRPAPAAA
jgi:hypothetical protein